MNSQGDPRVHLVMNLVLSGAFASVLVWGLAFVGVLETFAWTTVAIGTAVLMVLTYLFVLRP